jgi:hypothetical protein
VALLVWLHVPFASVKRAIEALKASVIAKHNRATQSDDKTDREELRESANQDNEAAKDLKDSLRGDGKRE